ncbi:MAG TPA: hypothetical protein DCG37_01000 [Lachnospiraceae bacterium]|nr:hypothetical protein [Lachnospiraceae bacterium]
MQNNQLDLIRQYCDTTGIRLSAAEKDLLCLVLENPARYDGFTSTLYENHERGRDFRDTWVIDKYWQYRISITDRLVIYKRYKETCDGEVNYDYYDWSNARLITDTRKIIEILREIKPEL